MQGSATPSTPTLSTPIRLLIAFVLGVLAGLVYLFDPDTTPFLWWLWVIPAAVLLIAMLLSILLDPAVRQGTIAPLRLIISLLLFVPIASAIVVALASQPAVSWIALGLLPFAIGLAAAFTIGGNGRLELAVFGAPAAWLGFGIPIVINAMLSYIAYEKITPGGDGGIILPIAIAIVMIGCVVAVPGGLVGRLLRNRFLGTPSTSPAQT